MKTKLILGVLLVGLTLFCTSCKKKGCTDPEAINYSEEAEKDDGSCVYETTVQTLSYGADAIQTMDLYLPAHHDENTKVVIMVHGGGWVVGYNETDKVTTFDGRFGWDILNPLLNEGYACVVMKYRTACYKDDPLDATFNTNMALDAMLQDINLAISKLKTDAPILGIGTDHFQLIGESAGGHIVLSYAVSTVADPAVKSVVSMFGPTAIDAVDWKENLRIIDSLNPEGIYLDDVNHFRLYDNGCVLETDNKLHVLSELRSFGDADTVKINELNPYLQSLSPTNPANINNDTPMFIQHGSNDALVPSSQADSMYIAITNAYGGAGCSDSDFTCEYKKKIYSNCGHGWTGGGCQRGQIINDIKKWIKAH